MKGSTRRSIAAGVALLTIGLGVVAVGSGAMARSRPPGKALPLITGSPNTSTTSNTSTTRSAAPPTTVTMPARVPGPGTLELYRVDRPEDGSGLHDVWAYRPDVPDSADLPVVYFLHGGPGSGQDVFSVGMAAKLDAYVAHGGKPFVLISPDGNGVAHSDPDWADSADGRDRIETWLTTDVIAAVEGDQPRDRQHRAIAGFSMGGYGAMNLALRHRDRYSQVVSIAGFFHAQDIESVFGGDPTLEAANSPDENLDAAPLPRILLMDGLQDVEPAVAGETQRFAGLLAARHVPSDIQFAPGQHDWDYVATQLPAVLTFLGDGFARSGRPVAPGRLVPR